jgi:ketosteroid isomerase-like protein
MKRIVLNTLSVIAACLAVGQAMAADEKGKSGNDEQVIKQLMQEWADALVKGDQAAIDRITSADWMLTDPQGMLISKAQSDAHRKSGTVKFESFKLDELKVRVYGDTAVVHGLATRKSSYQGKDTSGQYRSTDVFIKSNGGWQAIAAHVTRVVKP